MKNKTLSKAAELDLQLGCYGPDNLGWDRFANALGWVPTSAQLEETKRLADAKEAEFEPERFDGLG